ncbi:MAG: hypothetical protein CM1200mP10_08370 [Candidatus Neomarinimicrobiota bacterium]|nr:MAG: hypothetical protein CM1200mP10_08370 [Candidatus Neomarinimicrobiota bacterium]
MPKLVWFIKMMIMVRMFWKVLPGQNQNMKLRQKESYQRGAIDFKGQTMNLLKGWMTDVIIAGIIREPVTIMKTAEAMNYKPNFFGTGPTTDARVGNWLVLLGKVLLLHIGPICGIPMHLDQNYTANYAKSMFYLNRT